MTNVYMTWEQIKTKKIADELDFFYHEEGIRWQIYLLDGSDAFICYLPTQGTINAPGFICDDSSQCETDLTDFNDNYKSGATETSGVKD